MNYRGKDEVGRLVVVLWVKGWFEKYENKVEVIGILDGVYRREDLIRFDMID